MVRGKEVPWVQSRQALLKYYIHGLSAMWAEPMVRELVSRDLVKGMGGLAIGSAKPVGECFDEVGYPDPRVVERSSLQDYVSREKVDQLVSGNTTRPWAMK